LENTKQKQNNHGSDDDDDDDDDNDDDDSAAAASDDDDDDDDDDNDDDTADAADFDNDDDHDDDDIVVVLLFVAVSVNIDVTHVSNHPTLTSASCMALGNSPNSGTACASETRATCCCSSLRVLGAMDRIAFASLLTCIWHQTYKPYIITITKHASFIY
jgi:hypothetical protein